MNRLFYFLAVMASAALGAEESKEKSNLLLSLEQLYGKPEFSAKGYGVKWLEAGQGYVRLEKSKATKFRPPRKGSSHNERICARPLPPCQGRQQRQSLLRSSLTWSMML